VSGQSVIRRKRLSLKKAERNGGERRTPNIFSARKHRSGGSGRKNYLEEVSSAARTGLKEIIGRKHDEGGERGCQLRGISYGDGDRADHICIKQTRSAIRRLAPNRHGWAEKLALPARKVFWLPEKKRQGLDLPSSNSVPRGQEESCMDQYSIRWEKNEKSGVDKEDPRTVIMESSKTESAANQGAADGGHRYEIKYFG